MKRIWQMLILLFVMSLSVGSQVVKPTSAQNDDEKEPNVVAVQEATVDREDGAFVFSISGQQLDGCEFELTAEAVWQNDNVLFIDIMRVDDESAPVACSSELPTFSLDIAVDPYEAPEEESNDGEDENDESDMLPIITVKINDFLGQFPVAGMITEPDGPIVTEFPVVEMTASAVNIDEANIEYDEVEEHYLLTVSGSFPEGCEAPVIIYQNQDDHTLTVEIFRPMDSDPICPAMFLTYEDTIVLDGEFEGIMTINVNDTVLRYDANTNTLIGDESMTAVPTVIESVDVRVLESFPPQLSVQITGYHPDSCEFPVEVETTTVDNTITVEIYRNIPPNVRCAGESVPYETSINLGSFDPGDYTIDVNGTIVEITL